MTHLFVRDVGSGAGNCHCGAQEHHIWHPHIFKENWKIVGECVCNRRADDPIHIKDES